MNRLLLGTLTMCVVATVVQQSPLIRHRLTSPGSASAPLQAGRDGQAPRLQTRSWRGLSLQVPVSWQEVTNTDDHATWASRDRRQTVTIGAALDDGADITEAARAAAPAIAAAAPRGRVIEIARLNDSAGSVRVRAAASRSDTRDKLHLEQSWTRIPHADLIAIVSWTDSAGTWPRWARTDLPRPRR